jgi:transposase
VLVTRRRRYNCRRGSGALVRAHTPEHVVPSGVPTEALNAQVIVSKFGGNLQFYRQAEIYNWQGAGSTGRPWEIGSARLLPPQARRADEALKQRVTSPMKEETQTR